MAVRGLSRLAFCSAPAERRRAIDGKHVYRWTPKRGDRNLFGPRSLRRGREEAAARDPPPEGEGPSEARRGPRAVLHPGDDRRGRPLVRVRGGGHRGEEGR